MFFYDHLSKKSGISQFKTYLGNTYYNWELSTFTKDPLNYQVAEVRRSIRNSSIETQKGFSRLETSVCGTLEKGFHHVSSKLDETNWRLNEIREGVRGLHSLLDWKTDLMIQEHQITRQSLSEIIEILKIPESQKQRVYHIEKGKVYLQNALQDGLNSSFFSDAKEEFENALKFEKRDFYSFHNLGIIYLHNIPDLDIAKACNYFEMAGRYAVASANVEVGIKKEQLIKDAASSYNYASRCSYILNNLSAAILFAEEAAFKLGNGNVEYNYQRAKCHAASNSNEFALECLIWILEIDYTYFPKIISDKDFIGKEFIVIGLENYIEAKRETFVNAWCEVKESMSPESASVDEVETIEKLLIKFSYFNLIKVEQLCSERKKRGYYSYIFDKRRAQKILCYKSDCNLYEILNIEGAEFRKVAELTAAQKKDKVSQNSSIVLVVVLVVGLLLMIILISLLGQ